MKTLNQVIKEYTRLVQSGEIQTAYREIQAFMRKLRADFINKYPESYIGSVYQGNMDLTFFSLHTELQKEKGLKISVVYLHERGSFEVWLSARNRDIAKNYDPALFTDMTDEIRVFHNTENQEAIIESTLTSEPNFDDQDLLAERIHQGVEVFVTAVSSRF